MSVEAGKWVEIIHAGLNTSQNLLFCALMASTSMAPRCCRKGRVVTSHFYVSFPPVLGEVSLCSTSLSVQALGNYQQVYTEIGYDMGAPHSLKLLLD